MDGDSAIGLVLCEGSTSVTGPRETRVTANSVTSVPASHDATSAGRHQRTLSTQTLSSGVVTRHALSSRFRAAMRLRAWAAVSRQIWRRLGD